LVAIVLALSVPFVSFAANTVSFTETPTLTVGEDLSVNVKATLSDTGDVTILVIRSEESLGNTIPTNLSDENIVYINQKTGPVVEWTFKPETANCNVGDYITVFVGGTDVSTCLCQELVIESDTHMPGDIDGSGKVNNQDVTLLLKYVLGWDVEVVDGALDVDGSGKVNNQDVTLLLKYVLGWDVEIN
jgi:hypothetical protein